MAAFHLTDPSLRSINLACRMWQAMGAILRRACTQHVGACSSARCHRLDPYTQLACGGTAYRQSFMILGLHEAQFDRLWADLGLARWPRSETTRPRSMGSIRLRLAEDGRRDGPRGRDPTRFETLSRVPWRTIPAGRYA